MTNPPRHPVAPIQPSATALPRSGAEEPVSADERMAQAVRRIEASRDALIRCMSPDEPTPRRDGSRPPQDGAQDAAADDASFVQSLVSRIERNGLLQGSWRTLRALSRRWWKRQPWHSSVELVAQTLAHQTEPLIRRHPLASLAVAAALGAGMVAAMSAAKPWALQRVKHEAGPWKERLSSLLWSQLTTTPVQMALAGALAAWLADRANTAAQPSAEPPNPASSGHTGEAVSPTQAGSGPWVTPG